VPIQTFDQPAQPSAWFFSKKLNPWAGLGWAGLDRARPSPLEALLGTTRNSTKLKLTIGKERSSNSRKIIDMYVFEMRLDYRRSKIKCYRRNNFGCLGLPHAQRHFEKESVQILFDVQIIFLVRISRVKVHDTIKCIVYKGIKTGETEATSREWRSKGRRRPTRSLSIVSKERRFFRTIHAVFGFLIGII